MSDHTDSCNDDAQVCSLCNDAFATWVRDDDCALCDECHDEDETQLNMYQLVFFPTRTAYTSDT